MYDFVFQHRRSVPNVGDLHCSPAEYFDFGHQHVMGFGADVPACKTVVLGGGHVFDACVKSLIYRTGAAQNKVVWGASIMPDQRRRFDYDIAAAECALISTRNYGIKGPEYVPCVSAMSPLFDDIPAPEHEIVMFSHKAKSDGLRRVDGMPEMSNHNVTLPQAIAHIASGATVVTNSYHGTYWAMLMGRRVLCLPFNNKFRFFRENPVFAGYDNWPELIGAAEAREGVLSEARHLNRAFYDRVMNL